MRVRLDDVRAVCSLPTATECASLGEQQSAAWGGGELPISLRDIEISQFLSSRRNFILSEDTI